MKKILILVLSVLVSPTPLPKAPVASAKIRCARIDRLLYLPLVPNDGSAAATLLRQEYKSQARDWRRIAEERSFQQDVISEVCYCLAYAEVAGTSLEAMGTSTADLATLRDRGYRSAALFWEQRARKSAAEGSEASAALELEFFHKYAALAGEDPQSIPRTR